MRVFNSYDLELLKVNRYLQKCITDVRWNAFVYIDEIVYDNLTKEFINTLFVDVNSKKNFDLGNHNLTFRLFGQEHKITIGRLASLLELPVFDETDVDYKTVAVENFWTEIGIGSWHASRKRASDFKNLKFYMLHRIVGSSICAKDECDKVTDWDVIGMRLLHEKMNIHAACMFAGWLNHLARKSKGPLRVGAYVTKIAKGLGVFKEHLAGNRVENDIFGM